MGDTDGLPAEVATDATPTVSLDDAALDALVRAVDALDEGEDLVHEELRVAAAEDGSGDYAFESGGDRYTGLDEEGLREVAREHATPVSNWHFFERVVDDHPPRRAFLHWIESAESLTLRERYAALADGLAHEWGEVAVTVTLTDGGERVYEARHVDDAEASVNDLDSYDDPLDARRLVKFDDDGRYRPLKAAPTLPTGWVFADLGPRDLYETIETVYPATVVNWHREREGELDVTHWTETMDRQTGIYGVIKTWDRGEGYEHVNWVAEATCDDSECLKRREWEYDDETDLDVDGGDGVFPCREPCSVVVTAARKWTQLEGETENTYEFELTPSEKEQVETIIDAVADGRVDDIREADIYDGANRFRTRFLRAKRFDEAGNLCGVPTEPDAE
ncbi:DR2241 family protein [Halorubrum gandharaense]